MKYTCPVCGFDGLEEPAADFTICPSCGTEFGYTDFLRGHDDLRARWIAKGMRWHSTVIPAPSDWERVKYEQLRNIGVLDYKPTAEGTQPQPEISFIDLGMRARVVKVPDASIVRVDIQSHLVKIGRMFTQAIRTPAHA